MEHLNDSPAPALDFRPNDQLNRYGSLTRFAPPHDELEENESLNSGGAYCDSHDEAADDDFFSDFRRA